MVEGGGAAVAMAAGANPMRAQKRKIRLAPLAPVVVLLALCVLIAAINPNFLSLSNFVRIAQAAAIPLVLGLGAVLLQTGRA